MDNTFILKLQVPKYPVSLKRRVATKFINFFNSHNKHFNLIFKDDNRNKENFLQGGMINVEQGINIYHLLVQTILMEIPGDIVELGCFEGITSILMQKTLDQLNSKKILHVYDSFAGLPKKSKEDGDTFFEPGWCCTQKEKLIYNFQQHKLQFPIIHEGWFKDTLPNELPNEISFAHLDGDFYTSILESLTYVYPRLTKNAVVVIDDYCDPEIHNVNNILPGVKKACDDFFKDKKEPVNTLIAGHQTHGYFRKE